MASDAVEAEASSAGRGRALGYFPNEVTLMIGKYTSDPDLGNLCLSSKDLNASLQRELWSRCFHFDSANRVSTAELIQKLAKKEKREAERQQRLESGSDQLSDLGPEDTSEELRMKRQLEKLSCLAPSTAVTFRVRQLPVQSALPTNEEDDDMSEAEADMDGEEPEVIDDAYPSLKGWRELGFLPERFPAVHFVVEPEPVDDLPAYAKKRLRRLVRKLAQSRHLDFISVSSTRDTLGAFALSLAPAGLVRDMGRQPDSEELSSEPTTIALEFLHDTRLWELAFETTVQHELLEGETALSQIAFITSPASKKTPFRFQPSETSSESQLKRLCTALILLSKVSDCSTRLVVTGADRWDLAAFQVPDGITYEGGLPEHIQTTMQDMINKDEEIKEMMLDADRQPMTKTVTLLNKDGCEVKGDGQIVTSEDGFDEDGEPLLRLQFMTHQEAADAKLTPDSRGRHQSFV